MPTICSKIDQAQRNRVRHYLLPKLHIHCEAGEADRNCLAPWADSYARRETAPQKKKEQPLCLEQKNEQRARPGWC